jgi:chromosome partitioning protein
VIIDVQGTSNEEMAQAMCRADLVLVPMQAKHADAEVAASLLAAGKAEKDVSPANASRDRLPTRR